MVYALFTSLAQSSFSSFSDSPKLSSSKYQSHGLFVNAHKSFNAKFSPRQSTQLTRLRNVRRSPYICFFNGGGTPKGDLQEKETGKQWQILKRWEVPWEWQTVSLTSLACGLRITSKTNPPPNQIIPNHASATQLPLHTEHQLHRSPHPQFNRNILPNHHRSHPITLNPPKINPQSISPQIHPRLISPPKPPL
ncbi:hypothetical protein GBA52_002926 [Prunus armeniaca]|nr:hypothetical protein GBA52_002926 [Prunus armeniaca]